MKKLYTCLLSLMVSTLQAQPTITSAIEPAIGTSITTFYLDSSTVAPGNSGANQTWNFSAAVTNGITRIDEWVDPATTPYDTAFPGASVAEKTTDTSGGNLYLYFNRTSSQTDLIGMVFDFAGYPSVMSYSNPEIYRQYPMNYLGTLSDNFAGTSVIDFGPISITTYRFGTYSYTADAWGTLITPAATYLNVLRGKVNQYLTDSIVYSGMVVPTQVIHTASTAYFWSSATAGSVLYQFYIGYDTTITDSGTTVRISSSYQADVSSVAENSHNNNSAIVYPNPVVDFASVKIDNPANGKAEIIIYDITGRSITKMETTMHSGASFSRVIPVSDLAAGLYVVRTVCGERQWLTKMVKE